VEYKMAQIVELGDH
jgi:hypothetical protein